MNKEQKNKIEQLKNQLLDISEELEKLADAEQEKYDNLNEGMQSMEKFQKLQENADCLSTAQEQVEDVINTLEELEQ